MKVKIKRNQNQKHNKKIRKGTGEQKEIKRKKNTRKTGKNKTHNQRWRRPPHEPSLMAP
jgi:hypothetical protein